MVFAKPLITRERMTNTTSEHIRANSKLSEISQWQRRVPKLTNTLQNRQKSDVVAVLHATYSCQWWRF